MSLSENASELLAWLEARLAGGRLPDRYLNEFRLLLRDIVAAWTAARFPDDDREIILDLYVASGSARDRDDAAEQIEAIDTIAATPGVRGDLIRVNAGGAAVCGTDGAADVVNVLRRIVGPSAAAGAPARSEPAAGRAVNVPPAVLPALRGAVDELGAGLSHEALVRLVGSDKTVARYAVAVRAVRPKRGQRGFVYAPRDSANILSYGATRGVGEVRQRCAAALQEIQTAK